MHTYRFRGHATLMLLRLSERKCKVKLATMQEKYVVSGITPLCKGIGSTRRYKVSIVKTNLGSKYIVLNKQPVVNEHEV